ncbi:hypothetical protein JCM10207_000402 [Rhodosporidiobolus poonsookiae]
MPRKGSKRKKTRTHVKPTAAGDPNAAKTPKSFVVKSGTVGGSVGQLTKDVRKVLEPNTATRLRERKANRLRDYVSMSGPLGVTHLMVFSQPSSDALTPSTSTSAPSPTAAHAGETGEERAERSLLEGTTTVNLRLIRLPRGPTLSFKVLRYSLAADVLRMARRPRSVGREFAEAPLLILSGFGGEDKQLKLMTTVFQNLFPPIHVQTMALSSARRVVLLSYNPVTRTVDFRHFLISVRPVGVSKPIRKIIAGSTNNKALPVSRKRPLPAASDSEASDAEGGAVVPARPLPSGKGKAKGVLDLSRADDISDYILRQQDLGFVTSDSEVSDMSDAGSASGGSDSEADEKRGKVRLAGDYVGRGNRGKGVRGDKRAVRLVELGPRMELGLVKVEEGVGEGEVMFHEMVHKTNREASELAKVHAARRKLAAERRAQQEANVAAKKAAKKGGKGVSFDGDDAAEDEEEDEVDDEDKIDSDIEFDYEKEHGLPVPEDEELVDESDDDDEDGYGAGDAQMAPDSSAGESEDEDDEMEAWDDEDDSDTDPIPVSQAHLLDELPARPPPSKKPRRAGPASFSQKGFKRVDAASQRQAKPARGIALARGPTKREKKRVEEQEKRANRGKPKTEGRARYEDLQAGKEGGGAGGGGGSGKGGAGEKRQRECNVVTPAKASEYLGDEREVVFLHPPTSVNARSWPDLAARLLSPSTRSGRRATGPPAWTEQEKAVFDLLSAEQWAAPRSEHKVEQLAVTKWSFRVKGKCETNRSESKWAPAEQKAALKRVEARQRDCMFLQDLYLAHLADQTRAAQEAAALAEQKSARQTKLSAPIEKQYLCVARRTADNLPASTQIDAAGLVNTQWVLTFAKGGTGKARPFTLANLDKLDTGEFVFPFFLASHTEDQNWPSLLDASTSTQILSSLENQAPLLWTAGYTQLLLSVPAATWEALLSAAWADLCMARELERRVRLGGDEMRGVKKQLREVEEPYKRQRAECLVLYELSAKLELTGDSKKVSVAATAVEATSSAGPSKKKGFFSSFFSLREELLPPLLPPPVPSPSS